LSSYGWRGILATAKLRDGRPEVGGLDDSGETKTDQVARTVTLEAPVEAVWQALVEPERLSGWLGGRVALEARTGGKVSVVDQEGERRGTVEAVDAGRRLAFRLWRLPSPGRGLEGSRIEFVIEDLGATTRLTVVEDRLLPSSARPPRAGGAGPGRARASALTGAPPGG
jgi:uncharacterized protein YndB with AHSA1/START domain